MRMREETDDQIGSPDGSQSHSCLTWMKVCTFVSHSRTHNRTCKEPAEKDGIHRMCSPAESRPCICTSFRRSMSDSSESLNHDMHNVDKGKQCHEDMRFPGHVWEQDDEGSDCVSM